MTLDHFDLLDWKRRIFSLYGEVRAEPDPASAWKLWRQQRDELFRGHSQSPLPSSQRSGFEGLEYFDYDPAARVIAEVTPADGASYEVPTSDDGSYTLTRIATAAFELTGVDLRLELYWLEGYGGGLFLPFRDETSGTETYGAGRYLLDTVKGADLGTQDGSLILDFNFAYNPSCSYDPRWVCPLAPPPNRLGAPIRAGEKHR